MSSQPAADGMIPRDQPARGLQALWPFAADSASAIVEGWNPVAAPATAAALVLTGNDLPADRAAMFRRVAEAHDRLVPGGGIALLAGNRWRAAIKRGLPITEPGLHTMRRALHEAGFVDLRVGAVSPSAANPYSIRVAGMLTACLAPALLISARRGGTNSPRLLDRLAAHLIGAGSLPAGSQVQRVLCSGKDKTLVFFGSGDGRRLARVPWSVQSASAEASAHRLLEQLTTRPALAALLPRPLYRGHLDDQPVLVETLVPGRPLSTQLEAASRGRFAAEAIRFLGLLNPAPIHSSDHLMQRFALPLLDRLAPHLSDAAMLAPLHSALAEALSGVRCRIGLVHGDFGTKNIFTVGHRIAGVIDWEGARDEAPLILDTMGYLDSAQRRVQRGQTLADTLPLLATGPWPQAEEAAMLQRELEAGKTDPGRARRGLALLYWLTHVTPQLAFSGRDALDSERFDRVLRWVLATAKSAA